MCPWIENTQQFLQIVSNCNVKAKGTVKQGPYAQNKLDQV